MQNTLLVPISPEHYVNLSHVVEVYREEVAFDANPDDETDETEVIEYGAVVTLSSNEEIHLREAQADTIFQTLEFLHAVNTNTLSAINAQAVGDARSH